jgi:hypothetical protein
MYAVTLCGGHERKLTKTAVARLHCPDVRREPHPGPPKAQRFTLERSGKRTGSRVGGNTDTFLTGERSAMAVLP